MDIIIILKMISDENRLRILNLLKEQSLCVGEIQTILNISQSNASRHLEKLKSNGLITNHKKAQWIFYQLSNAPLKTYPFIKHLLYEDIKSVPSLSQDLLKLQRYKASELSCQDLKNVGFDYDKLNF